MKNSILAVALLTLSSIASAVVIPGWERPTFGTELTEIVGTKPVYGPLATYLTLNQRDDAKEPTSFTLTEFTGVICVTTPCPSTRQVEFRITDISQGFHSDVVRYEAIEVLKNIPPNVKIAPRKLFVTESTMEIVSKGGIGYTQVLMWQVEVAPFNSASRFYYGKPEALVSIATLN